MGNSLCFNLFNESVIRSLSGQPSPWSPWIPRLITSRLHVNPKTGTLTTMAAKNRRASPENVKKCTANDPGESGTGENTPQSLTYVSWENVQNLLRTAKQ